jgi:hypothetical protein
MTLRPLGSTRQFGSRFVAACCLAAVIWPAIARAQQAPAEPRVPVAKTVSAAGTLLARDGDEHPWVPAGEVFSRDRLLALAGMKAVLEPAPETVRLTLWGNLPAQSPFPLLESSAELHDSRGFDLDMTLLSGRAVLTNTKKSGAVKIWLRMPGDGWEIILEDPGATVAVEQYGRWPRGVPFSRDPLSPARPITVVNLQVLKGQAEVHSAGRQQRLTAPPGPAFLHWDSAGAADSGPQRRGKRPVWATDNPPELPELKPLGQVEAKYLELLKEKSPVDALQALLTAGDADKDSERAALEREFAVLGLAATGALPQLADVMGTTKDPELRETIVLAMRHWIGSAAGRDLLLYAMLVGHAGYTERHADTVLQLLHSPFDASDPVTYQTLIAYLQHDRLAIRELARWHLYRLVPQGAKIPYDAAGSPEDRAKAAREWKQLIPDGEVPKKPAGEQTEKQPSN